LEEIRTDWASGRIVKPDVKSIVEGATGPRAYSNFENALVRYPNIGGFSSIYRPFAPPAASIKLQSKVTKVEISTRIVHLASGERLPFSAIVSTMPLDVLAEITCDIPEEMKNAARSLTSNSLHLANFAVEGAQQTDLQRVYSANLETPFHKLVINSNSSPALRDEPRVGVQAEVSFSRQKHVTIDGLLERCWLAIEEMGLLGPNARVTHSDLRTIERAYPVATRQSKGAPELLIDKFAQLGIFCAGRFGMWRYVNSDDAFHLGRQAIVKAQDFSSNHRRSAGPTL
jgi:protoporphyrinogen oxidase